MKLTFTCERVEANYLLEAAGSSPSMKTVPGRRQGTSLRPLCPRRGRVLSKATICVVPGEPCLMGTPWAVATSRDTSSPSRSTEPWPDGSGNLSQRTMVWFWNLELAWDLYTPRVASSPSKPSRHRPGPSDCPRGAGKADGRWAGPHRSGGWGPQDEGSTRWTGLGPRRGWLGSPHGGGDQGSGRRRGPAETSLRALSKHPYRLHFLFGSHKTMVFFSLLWAFNTHLQLCNHLAEGTPNENSSDIDFKLELLFWEKISKRQIRSNNAPSPQLNNKHCIFLNITEQSWYRSS